MSEPTITPEQDRLLLAYEVQRRLRERSDRIAELEERIATEPERIRAAVVEALTADAEMREVLWARVNRVLAEGGDKVDVWWLRGLLQHRDEVSP